MQKITLWFILSLLGIINSKICPTQRPYLSTPTMSGIGISFLQSSNPPCMKTCPPTAAVIAPTSNDGRCICPADIVAYTGWANMLTGICSTVVRLGSGLYDPSVVKQYAGSTPATGCPDPTNMVTSSAGICLCTGSMSVSLDGQSCVSTCPTNTYQVTTNLGGNYCVCNQGMYINFEQNACYIACPSNSASGYYCTVSGADPGTCQTGCATCSGNDYTCQSCTVGYSISGTTCSQCTGTTQCSTCDTGCASCSGTASTCQACIAGYGLSGTTCSQCTGATFSPGGTAACSACDTGCATCSGTSTNCQSCKPGYTQQGSTCVLDTPNGGMNGRQNEASDDDGGLSKGAIIGIAIGCSVGGIALLGAGFILLKKFAFRKPNTVQPAKTPSRVETA